MPDDPPKAGANCDSGRGVSHERVALHYSPQAQEVRIWCIVGTASPPMGSWADYITGKLRSFYSGTTALHDSASSEASFRALP